MLLTILTILLGWLLVSFVVSCAVGRFIRARCIDQARMEEQASAPKVPSRAIPHRV